MARYYASCLRFFSRPSGGAPPVPPDPDSPPVRGPAFFLRVCLTLALAFFAIFFGGLIILMAFSLHQ